MTDYKHKPFDPLSRRFDKNGNYNKSRIDAVYTLAWCDAPVDQFHELSRTPEGIAILQGWVEFVSRGTLGVNTIFKREGNDYVRIATTVPEENGCYAIGTKLNRQSPAYQRVIQGKSYKGPSELFGLTYQTIYQPILKGKFVLFSGILV